MLCGLAVCEGPCHNTTSRTHITDTWRCFWNISPLFLSLSLFTSVSLINCLRICTPVYSWGVRVASGPGQTRRCVAVRLSEGSRTVLVSGSWHVPRATRIGSVVCLSSWSRRRCNFEFTHLVLFNHRSRLQIMTWSCFFQDFYMLVFISSSPPSLQNPSPHPTQPNHRSHAISNESKINSFKTNKRFVSCRAEIITLYFHFIIWGY